MTAVLERRHPDSVTTRPSRVAVILLGALVSGALWGSSLRLWMRYISDDPEFTWSGTLYIVLVPAVLAVLVRALVLVRRRTVARRSLRGVLVAATALLGVSAGILFLPTLVLGAAAYGPRRAPWWARLLPATLAIGLPTSMFVAEMLEPDNTMSGPRFGLAVLWYAAIGVIGVWYYARAWGRIDG